MINQNSDHILHKEVQDTSELLSIFKRNGLVVDGNLSDAVYSALHQVFPKDKSESGVALESQQQEFMAQVGAWQVLVNSGWLGKSHPANALAYVTGEPSFHDVVRFSDAASAMTAEQAKASCLYANWSRPSTYGQALVDCANEAGIAVVSGEQAFEDYLKGVKTP